MFYRLVLTFPCAGFEFVHHAERKEFTVGLFVKPCAFEIKQSDAGGPTQGQRVQRELLDRPVCASIGFVVENVNRPVADLQEVNVTGRWPCEIWWNRETYFRERLEIRPLQNDRDFGCNRDGITAEHEMLE